MVQLAQPVGKNQLNLRKDVLIVQTLLNKQREAIGLRAPLEEDGLFGPRTGSAILEFQRHFSLPSPDGVVHPGGPTLRALGEEPQQPSERRPANVPPHVAEFVKMVLPVAGKVKERWGIPVSVLLAQAAIESGWGKQVKGNAYFGIKGKSASGASTKFATTEFINDKKVGMQDEFRAYADFEEAAHDYGRFLNENRRYRYAFQHKHDPEKFAEHLAKAGYATDPEYHKKIVSIINRFQFDRYDV